MSSSPQVYVKGDQVRRVDTPADRVDAVWNGFKPQEESASPVEAPQGNDGADVSGSPEGVTVSSDLGSPGSGDGDGSDAVNDPFRP